MELTFSCPKCSTGAVIHLSDEEVKNIQETIIDKGRSPTLLSRCKNGHELLVTLYFRDGELGVRDVVMPIEPGSTDESKQKPNELDWVRHTFGGGK
ncbi:hypothetical protein EU527_02835 [Candidatus Thorarchaeota archaeon]|nr:MAG: hypothetical protein EU527_02835 [Candidatus Thorarchaeota archaeon]